MKKLISVIMTIIMVMSTATMGFAEVDIALKVDKYIGETEQGVYINEKYYTFGEFEKLLDTATEIEQPKTRSILVAGAFAIPGVGAFIVTAAGIIIFNDEIIEAGTKIYKTIAKWFEDRGHIAYKEVVDSIPKKLRDGNTVDLNKFKKRVINNKRVGYQEETTNSGWVIEKDSASSNAHGGSVWKLKTKKQFFGNNVKNRTATLNKDGKVLRD